jgi:hypothetical protein
MCHGPPGGSPSPAPARPGALVAAEEGVGTGEGGAMNEKCHHERCTCRATGEGSAPDYCSEPCALGKIEFGDCACGHPDCEGHD